MKFVDMVMNIVSSGFNYIGNLIAILINYLSKPLSYLYYFLDGVFYFLYQIFEIVVKVIMIFVALFQFFIAIVTGFMRTLIAMLTINYNTTVNYPSSSYKGIQAVLDVFQPMGMLTVVPMVILAVVWFYFAKKIIGLIGGDVKDA